MKAEYRNKYYTQSHDDGCFYETAFDTGNIKIAVWCSPGNVSAWFYTRLRAHLRVDWSGEAATTLKVIAERAFIHLYAHRENIRIDKKHKS